MKSGIMSDSDSAANFPMWARTRDVTRFLVRNELFKLILDVPGSVFECGVHLGGGLASWIHLSEVYEPVAFTRRIFGFDTFRGFPSVKSEDRRADGSIAAAGDFFVDRDEEVIQNLEDIDRTRKVSNCERLEIVVGDATTTIPALLEGDRSVTIALLYLDFDLYEPTLAALEACLPRMPRGALVVLDQFGDRDWPGETAALLDSVDLRDTRLRTFHWAPRISYFAVGC